MRLPRSDHELHSSLISSVDPTSALAEGYDLARTPYNSRVFSIWTVVVSF